MAAQAHFDRNVRPISIVDDDQESFHTEDEDESGQGDLSDDENVAPSENEDDEAVASADDEPVTQRLSTVSFGALKKANDTISRKRKADDENGPDKEAKLESLKKRLQLIKQQQPSTLLTKKQPKAPVLKSQSHARERDASSDDDTTDDSGPEEASSKGRAKHAPASQSSKFQVSRKRQVIDVPKRVIRDPRFDAVTNDTARPEHRENAYAFLRDYEKSEMVELKTAIKKTKSADDKDTLRRKLNAMENRTKAREAKEREQDIVRRHRKEQREQVRDGKTPYFLKRSEVKQQALVEKFDKMKSKDRERLMDRRRKKESQKEKRRMPELRRGFAT